MVKILTEPKNALTKQFKKLLDLDGVELEFSLDAVRAVASKAIKLNTGARGLRSILEGVMMDVMYDVPQDKSIVKVIITGDTIEGNSSPEIIRKETSIA